VEDVQIGMSREQGSGDLRPLVVAWHQEHGHAEVGHPSQGLEGRLHQAGRHPAAVEEVTAVDHHVDLAGHGRRKGRLVVGHEVVAPPPTLNPGPSGQVEADVGVGNKEDAHKARGPRFTPGPRGPRS